MKSEKEIKAAVQMALGAVNYCLQLAGSDCKLAIIGNSKSMRIGCDAKSVPMLCGFKDEIINHLYFCGVDTANRFRFETTDTGAFFEIW